MGNEDSNNLISNKNRSYFSRLHQKCLELLDQIEFDMNSLESASNFYLTAQNHRLNEIMKTLTIVASIFIPLTFIVGVYGMNFKYMPELEYKNGYFITLLIMFFMFLGMTYYFKRKKWF
jgi:magnesium transporter